MKFNDGKTFFAYVRFNLHSGYITVEAHFHGGVKMKITFNPLRLYEKSCIIAHLLFIKISIYRSS